MDGLWDAVSAPVPAWMFWTAAAAMVAGLCTTRWWRREALRCREALDYIDHAVVAGAAPYWALEWDELYRHGNVTDYDAITAQDVRDEVRPVLDEVQAVCKRVLAGEAAEPPSPTLGGRDR